MTLNFRSKVLSTTILASLCLGLAPLAAAMADEAPALDEVIVTAQKREQNIQEVPLAVQVIGANQLAAAGVVNFEDFNRISPSMVIRTDVQPVNATVSIRGIGTNSFGIGVEPSVAVVVDDVPLAFQARAFSNMSDISRVEVLGGPQSTLYGKSASAGLINIVTPNPTSSLTAQVGGTYTNDNEKDVSAAISGPISNNLGFRVAATYSDFPGTITNLYNGDTSDGALTTNIHGKLVWDPTAEINVVANLDYTNGRTTNDVAWIALAPNANLRGNAAYPPSSFLGGVTPSFQNTKIYDNYGIGARYSDDSQSLKVSWDLGGPTLMSISSHSRYFLDDHQDVDYTAVAALDNRQMGNFHNTQWTEELRLVSPGSGPLRYTVGLFYADVDYSRAFSRGPYFSLARWDATDGSKQDAAFGQVEYDLIDNLTLIGGLRVGQERINYTFLDHTVAAGLVNNWAGDNSNTYYTYKVGPQYQLTDNVMLFATHSTGHKGATYDLTTGFNTNRANGGPVLPETSSDYEIGAKMQFLGRRLTVNPTIFTTTYDNFQAQGIEILPDGTTNFRLANVGQVRTRGIEADNSFKVSQDLTIGASATYLDAHILSFPGAQCFPGQTAAQGCVGNPTFQNLSGAALPDAAKWKFTSDATYIHALGFIPWDGVYRANYTYTSKVNYALTQDPQTIQPGYGLLNLSAGLRDPDERYEVTLFVNNVLDTHYHQNIQDNFSTFNSRLATAAEIPRDFSTYGGIRLNAKF